MQIYSAKFCDGKSNIVFSILEYISFESSLYLYLGFIYVSSVRWEINYRFAVLFRFEHFYEMAPYNFSYFTHLTAGSLALMYVYLCKAW